MVACTTVGSTHSWFTGVFGTWLHRRQHLHQACFIYASSEVPENSKVEHLGVRRTIVNIAIFSHFGWSSLPHSEPYLCKSSAFAKIFIEAMALSLRANKCMRNEENLLLRFSHSATFHMTCQTRLSLAKSPGANFHFQ